MKLNKAETESIRRRKIIADIFEKYPTFRFKETMKELKRILEEQKK